MYSGREKAEIQTFAFTFFLKVARALQFLMAAGINSSLKIQCFNNHWVLFYWKHKLHKLFKTFPKFTSGQFTFISIKHTTDPEANSDSEADKVHDILD